MSDFGPQSPFHENLPHGFLSCSILKNHVNNVCVMCEHVMDVFSIVNKINCYSKNKDTLV